MRGNSIEYVKLVFSCAISARNILPMRGMVVSSLRNVKPRLFETSRKSLEYIKNYNGTSILSCEISVTKSFSVELVPYRHIIGIPNNVRALNFCKFL